jgi:hypothetical protein
MMNTTKYGDIVGNGRAKNSTKPPTPFRFDGAGMCPPGQLLWQDCLAELVGWSAPNLSSANQISRAAFFFCPSPRVVSNVLIDDQPRK